MLLKDFEVNHSFINDELLLQMKLYMVFLK